MGGQGRRKLVNLSGPFMGVIQSWVFPLDVRFGINFHLKQKVCPAPARAANAPHAFDKDFEFPQCHLSDSVVWEHTAGGLGLHEREMRTGGGMKVFRALSSLGYSLQE